LSERRTSWWRGLFVRTFVAFWLSFAAVLVAVEVTFPLLANNEIHRADDPILLPRLRDVARRLTEAADSDGVRAVAIAVAAPLAVEHVTLRVFDDRGNDILGGEMVAGLHEFLERAANAPYLLGQRAHGRDLLGVERIEAAGSVYGIAVTRPIEPFRVLQTMLREAEPRRAVFAAAALGALASLVFALSLSLPLRRLAETASRVRVEDLTVRVDDRICGRADEVGEVAREFNRALERVEAADENRKMLLRDISHELRGPLTRLQIAAGLAAQADRSDGRLLRPGLEQVQREGERLNQMIGQLLDLSQLEYRSSQERKLVHLDRVVNAIVEDVASLAEDRGSRVVLEGNPPLRVLGDAYSLSAAVDNLVRNALLHSPSGTHVHIDVTEVGKSSIQITVSDDGPGVSGEFAQRMFDPFVRGPQQEPSSGSGVGLALAKRAIEAHGGRVEASARPEGSGLIMTVTLPRA